MTTSTISYSVRKEALSYLAGRNVEFMKFNLAVYIKIFVIWHAGLTGSCNLS